MLAKYLKEMRQSRVVSATQALSSLGDGWTQGANGAVQREFQFDDFVQASNFMNRYAAYCSQVNHTPEWANVYNKVSVTLQNKEFKGVTSKEVDIGQYLNTVSKATLNQDVEDVLTQAQITAKASLEVESLLNDQDESTSIFALDERKQARAQLYLT